MRRRARRRPFLSWDRLEDRAVPSTLIALIDSGVDLTSANDAPYYDFTNAYDAYDKKSAAADHGLVQDTSLQHGHGATVADSIVRGIQDMLAQPGMSGADVKILPIRDTSTDLNIDPNALVRGVYYAADHGAAVINLSLRVYNRDFVLNDPSDPHNGSTLSQAIQYAQAHGAVVVTAAGNEGQSIEVDPFYMMPADADDPAYNGLGVALGNVLVAAAVDSSGNLSSLTNWGAVHVDVGAPTDGSGATSYSAGYASGVAGVVAAMTPSMSPQRRVELIKQTVQPHAQSVGAWSTSGGNISPVNLARQIVQITSTATATSLGQDGQDFVGTGRDAGGPDGRQDIHIALAGLPASKSISWIDVTGYGGGEWRYDGAYGTDLAALVRSPGATTADLYVQPYQDETGREFAATIHYGDGTSVVLYIPRVYASANLPDRAGLVDRTAGAGGIVTARGQNGTAEGMAKAFDGDSGTKWLDFSPTSWLQYQFAGGASYVIDQYTITSANDTATYPGRAPSSWALEGSDDGVNWTTLDVRAGQADTANFDTRTYSFSNATAYRMYRLDDIRSNGDPIIQLAEFRLLGPGAAPVDLALGKAATSSSVEGAGYDPGKAVDGDPATRWSSGQWMQPGQVGWLSIDLGASYHVNEVKLDWETAFAVDYQVQVSRDGTSWTTIRSVAGNDRRGPADLGGLSGSGRYVRIYGTKTNGYDNYSLYGVSVYGTPA
ncbi:Thermophilic serine proteinase precursor [Aquisphaera giovannonii]|uniref:Thermophilic serine proteinase n=1 Tax=Aquisphaera giovannonii TaxID=406548 RepID=A0A5B9VXL3_9BACT|nr:discoidin domain-containing protein [Aquisphaera giovannonii]QEH32859.1 Thermophilic serine proteinase precursor [Aquisphaera giovannonii]